MNDPKVFKETWQAGNTSGIFQFESQGMKNFMKELKPDSLEDIIAGSLSSRVALAKKA